MTTYPNTDEGTEARVMTLANGKISVTLFDIDAGAAVPFCKIFAADRSGDAHAYAAKIAGA